MQVASVMVSRFLSSPAFYLHETSDYSTRSTKVYVSTRNGWNGRPFAHDTGRRCDQNCRALALLRTLIDQEEKKLSLNHVPQELGTHVISIQSVFWRKDGTLGASVRNTKAFDCKELSLLGEMDTSTESSKCLSFKAKTIQNQRLISWKYRAGRQPSLKWGPMEKTWKCTLPTQVSSGCILNPKDWKLRSWIAFSLLSRCPKKRDTVCTPGLTGSVFLLLPRLLTTPHAL